MLGLCQAADQLGVSLAQAAQEVVWVERGVGGDLLSALRALKYAYDGTASALSFQRRRVCPPCLGCEEFGEGAVKSRGYS